MVRAILLQANTETQKNTYVQHQKFEITWKWIIGTIYMDMDVMVGLMSLFVNKHYDNTLSACKHTCNIIHVLDSPCTQLTCY